MPVLLEPFLKILVIELFAVLLRKNKYLVFKRKISLFFDLLVVAWEIFPNVGTTRTGFSRTFLKKRFYLSKGMGAKILIQRHYNIKPKNQFFTSHYLFSSVLKENIFMESETLKT